jgi:hypothetical protein
MEENWNLWLNSTETRLAVKLLSEEAKELGEEILSGSHLMEREVEKIALDFSYSSGMLDGLRKAIQMIKYIKDYIEEEESGD